ncbi:MAG TPA: hypothetical protein VFK41_10420 [Nocardioidaceae bacterium]|nr:hypothetical protein [Nocardioidaceae bacterium]
MLIDPVGFALTMDALTHAGPAVPTRITNRAALCASPVMPRTTLPEFRVIDTGYYFLTGSLLGPQVTAEPRLPAYAYRYGGY